MSHPAWASVNHLYAIGANQRFPDDPDAIPAVIVSLPSPESVPGYLQAPWFPTHASPASSEAWLAEARRVLAHRQALMLASENGDAFSLVLDSAGDYHDSPQSSFLLRRLLHASRQDWFLLFPADLPAPRRARRFAREGDSRLWQFYRFHPDQLKSPISPTYIVPFWSRERILELLPTPETIWEWLASHGSLQNFLLASLPVLAAMPAARQDQSPDPGENSISQPLALPRFFLSLSPPAFGDPPAREPLPRPYPASFPGKLLLRLRSALDSRIYARTIATRLTRARASGLPAFPQAP